MRPLYIFDLDGTLALVDHRRPLLADRSDKRRWQRFFAACVDDPPNPAVVAVLNALLWQADVQIWAGRSDEVRAQTVRWIAHHTLLMRHEADRVLRMRRRRDYTPDEILKRSWLDAMPIHDRARLVAVFDDRDKVVAMWRAAGVTCFQVAPGAF